MEEKLQEFFRIAKEKKGYVNLEDLEILTFTLEERLSFIEKHGLTGNDNKLSDASMSLYETIDLLSEKFFNLTSDKDKISLMVKDMIKIKTFAEDGFNNYFILNNEGRNVFKSNVLLYIDFLHENYITLLGLVSFLSSRIKNSNRIQAKISRKKRKKKENPNIEKAREMAIEIWRKRRSLALLDTAYEIKRELNLRDASTTIQEWIRDLNPNAKKKKAK